MPQIVAQPFVVDEKPVRIVSYDWLRDEEYADHHAEGIIDVFQVTWSDSQDPLSGWMSNIHLHADGRWSVGDSSVRYPTRDDAAHQAVMDWIAYERTLTDEDYEKLAAMIIPALTMPGAKPPPIELNRLKNRLMP